MLFVLTVHQSFGELFVLTVHQSFGEFCRALRCALREADVSPAQNLTRTRYLPSFTFQDPIVKVSSLEAFALNLRLLRTVFDVDFDLHSCRVAGPTEIVTRCASRTRALLIAHVCSAAYAVADAGKGARSLY